MINCENKQNPQDFSRDTRLSPADIPTQHAFMQQLFLTFYSEQGYQIVPPESLLPHEDTSVIFTGATITALKRQLQEGIRPPGYCLVQKCLRVKRLEQMYDLSVYPDWTHYFTMCGILAAPDRREEVIEEAYQLLTQRLGLMPENVLILASSQDRDLFGPLSIRGITVQEDTESLTYYRWTYGMPNIYGRGITFLLRHDGQDAYRELGNIISVEDSDGKVKAYEFGFGLESLLSKMHGHKKPIEVSMISAVVPYREGPQETFLDTLVAAVVIYHHDVEPGRGKGKHILKKLVKGLSYIRRKMGISIEQIRDQGNLFERAEFGETNGSGDRLSAGIAEYENRLIKYIDYAKNQVHAHRLRGQMGQYLVDKLKREGGNLGITPADVEEVVAFVLQ